MGLDIHVIVASRYSLEAQEEFGDGPHRHTEFHIQLDRGWKGPGYSALDSLLERRGVRDMDVEKVNNRAMRVTFHEACQLLTMMGWEHGLAIRDLLRYYNILNQRRGLRKYACFMVWDF